MIYRLGIAVFALLPLLLASGCSREAPPDKQVIRPIRAIKVGDMSPVSTRAFPGQAKATQEVNLSFRVSGPLVVLPNDLVGKEVKQGEVLARIDPRDFEVSLESVRGELDKSRATLERARSEYERELSILKQEPGATSKTAVARKREAVEKEKGGIRTLEASVEAAEDQLSYTYLKAPFDGIIVATYAENFEDVQAKQAIMRILDSSKVEMVINIPENLISYSSYIEKVIVVFDAFPGRELEATIKEVGTEASQTTRTYPVTLIMDQPDDVTILPGMAGKTIRAVGPLPDDIARTGIAIPVSATFSPGESPDTYIWIIDPDSNTVSRRKVITGGITDSGILIREGLEAGEWVAIAGVHYLKENQQVRLLKNATE